MSDAAPIVPRNGMFSRRPRLPERPAGEKAKQPVAAPVVVKPALEEFTGTVVREVFRAAGNGFVIIAVRLKPSKIDTTIQVATNQVFQNGDAFVAHGVWTTYKGKPQIKCASISLKISRTAKGLSKWMRDAQIKGLGEKTIEKLVNHFGADLGDVLGDFDALMASGLIREDVARDLSHIWSLNERSHELTALLNSYGLDRGQVQAILRTHGVRIEHILKTNPWVLTKIDGVGFVTTDKIASMEKLDMNSPNRILAGLEWVLGDRLTQNGHCGVPPDELMDEASHLLKVSHEVIEASYGDFVDGVSVIYDEDVNLVYMVKMWEAECKLAEFLVDRIAQNRDFCTGTEAEEAILAAEDELDVRLDRNGGQLEAAKLALTKRFCIITGGPGTGKSTTQRVIVRALELLGVNPELISLGAPTGRAAKRLAETSQRSARTIHRMLEYSPFISGFQRNAQDPLKSQAVIIDEFSMVDLPLAASLVEALNDECILTIVGDYDQLPSVGPGQVLRDLISSGLVPVARLTRVHRQVEGSGIAMAAQRINNGLSPMESDTLARDFSIKDTKDEDIVSRVVEHVRFTLPEMGFDPMKDVQILTSMRSRGCGVEELNAALKAALNPALDDGNSIMLAGRYFTIGDRVMQTKNNYNKGVYNGEVGTVTAVARVVTGDGSTDSLVTVDFDGVEAQYKSDDAREIELSYAATVHKSQGCEFPVVIFVVAEAHKRMLNRNLFYTGLTRAKTECLMIGSQKVIDAAPQNNDTLHRHTGLQKRLHLMQELNMDMTMRIR